MARLKSVTVKLTEAELRNVEAMVEAGHYQSRSELICDAIRSLLRRAYEGGQLDALDRVERIGHDHRRRKRKDD